MLDPCARPPHVAYAVGRAVGGAVVRNRVRRRLRAVTADLAADLPAGWYLIGARPAAAGCTTAQLRAALSAVPARLGDTAR